MELFPAINLAIHVSTVNFFVELSLILHKLHNIVMISVDYKTKV